MDIAQTLKEFRQAHGLEQDDLAKLIGTTQQTISNWEGGTMPRAMALRKINHVISTYRAGEALQPQADKPKLDPHITEIHEVPIGDVAQLARYSPTRSDPAIKTELETAHRVAESLKEAMKEHGPRMAPPLSIQFERQFVEALPDDLKQNCGRKVAIHGHMYRFDYCSDKIVAELEILIPRIIAGSVRNISTHSAARTLWRMSSYRLLTKDSHPNRKYFLFLTMLNDTGGPLPMQTITRLTGEAALHGISVVWTGSNSAAEYVAAIESNRIQTFTADQSDEDDYPEFPET